MERPDAPFACHVQLRAHHDAVPATVKPTDTGFRAEFDTPEKSVTPGQWAVLYDDEACVLAGGIVDRFE